MHNPPVYCTPQHELGDAAANPGGNTSLSLLEMSFSSEKLGLAVEILPQPGAAPVPPNTAAGSKRKRDDAAQAETEASAASSEDDTEEDHTTVGGGTILRHVSVRGVRQFLLPSGFEC